MSEGLTRDEDTALRCLAALSDAGRLSEEHAALMADLRSRDRRRHIRREGIVVPKPRVAEDDQADTSLLP